MDVSDANTYFEWKVNNYWMQKWKSAKYQKGFLSPTFNAIGGEWNIGIYPNGWTKEGTADLDIRCTSIESDEKEINICHYIEIKALNHCQLCFDGKRVKKGDDVPCNSPFKWNDIKNESQITIGIKIWRKGSIEKNEARLVSNIYSEKMRKLHNESSQTKKENQELKQVIEANRDEKRETKSQMESLARENEEITTKLDNEIAAKERMIKLQNECNETIRSLQKQSKQMSDEKRNEKSENVSLRRENQEITSKLKDFAMRDLKQQQHIKKLQKETRGMRAELDKIAMKEIKTLDVTQEIVIDEETMQKQKEFDEQMQMDEKRLNEWKCDSILIQNECKSEQKENEFETDNNETTTHLLNRFMECKTLCDKQQIRMENVIMYCSKLNKIKKILKKESVRCNQLVEERK
eukprot:658076_1